MNELSKLELAAVVLKTLPQSQAAKVVEKLDPSEIRSVFNAKNRVKEVSLADIEKTLDALDAAAKQLSLLDEQPIGHRHSQQPTAAPSSDPGSGPFSFLEDITSSLCQRLLADEHPKNIAIVLTWLSPVRASDLLKSLEPVTRVSVVRRLCETECGTSEEIAQLRYALKLRLKKFVNLDAYNEDGIEIAAKVLSCTDPDTQHDLLQYITQSDPELAKKLEQSVFYFDDIQKLSNRDVTVVLKNIDTSFWAPALKRAKLETQTKILRNMAEMPAKYLNKEISEMTCVDEHICRHAQQQVINTILRLTRVGKIDSISQSSNGT